MTKSEDQKLSLIATILCLSFLIPMIYMIVIGSQRENMRQSKTICKILFNISEEN